MNGWSKFCFSALICFGSFGVEAAKPTAAGLAFFEKKIRPVLVERCYQCHSADSEKVKGGPVLDMRAGVREGGDSGTRWCRGMCAKASQSCAISCPNR